MSLGIQGSENLESEDFDEEQGHDYDESQDVSHTDEDTDERSRMLPRSR